MKYFMLLLFVGSLLACGASTPEPKGTEENLETNSVQQQETTHSSENWDDFWKTFQKAVLDGNQKEVKAMTHFGAISEAEFDSMYEVFFGGNYKTYFEKASAADVKADAFEVKGVEVSEVRLFGIYESGMDDEGNEYESGVNYYFGKVDGQYRLVSIFAAG